MHPMASLAASRTFREYDADYHLCCCCNIHVSTLAKAIAVVCILADVTYFMLEFLTNTASVLSVAICFFVCFNMWIGVLEEHRVTLLSLLIELVLLIAFLAIFVILLILALFTEKLPRDDAVVILIMPILITIFVWCFAVLRLFYQFLNDRAEADRAEATAPCHGMMIFRKAGPTAARSSRIRGAARSVAVLMPQSAHAHVTTGDGWGRGWSGEYRLNDCPPPAYDEPPPPYDDREESIVDESSSKSVP